MTFIPVSTFDLLRQIFVSIVNRERRFHGLILVLLDAIPADAATDHVAGLAGLKSRHRMPQFRASSAGRAGEGNQLIRRLIPRRPRRFKFFADAFGQYTRAVRRRETSGTALKHALRPTLKPMSPPARPSIAKDAFISDASIAQDAHYRLSVPRIYAEMGACIFCSEQWARTIDKVEQDAGSNMRGSSFGQFSANFLCVDVWSIIIISGHQVDDIVFASHGTELFIAVTQAEKFQPDCRALIVNIFFDVNPVEKIMSCLIRPIERLDLALSGHQDQREILIWMLNRSVAQMLSESAAFVRLVRLQAGWRFIKAIIDGNDEGAFAYDLTREDGDLLDILRFKLKVLGRRKRLRVDKLLIVYEYSLVRHASSPKDRIRNSKRQPYPGEASSTDTLPP